MKLFEFLSEAISSSNIYTVRSGDSLPSIASSNDTTVDGIMWQNPQFASPSDIQPGSRIRLPGAGMPTTASVSSGKTTTASVSSGKTTTTPARQGRGGASGNAKIALDYFIQQGWSSAQAAGIVANLQAESTPNINIDAVGDGGAAYGIAQWHGPRQKDFQRVMGRPINGSSLQDQLKFIQWELTDPKSKERRSGDRLRAAKTAEDAAAIVDQYYERSSGAHRQKRIAMAAALVPATRMA